MKHAERRKYHYIYKITRTDDSGKYYIGMHSTDDLEDGYFGSGSLLSKSIKRHGQEKHIKEILEFLHDREALRFREKELITKELLEDKKCMNLVPGGGGGADVGRLGAESLKRKRLDPEFEKQYQARMLEVGAKFRKRRQSDPEFQQKLIDANMASAKAMKQKRLDDPEYDRMMFEKMSKSRTGKKDSEQAKANKRAAQALVAERDLSKKQVSAAKAREALASKSLEEVLDMKRRQSEGAVRLAKDLANDPDRWASIVKKKAKTRIANGTNIVNDETRLKLSKANTGKKRSAKIIETMKLRMKDGSHKTASGTVWMKLGDLRKRVRLDGVQQHIQQGFVYGKS